MTSYRDVVGDRPYGIPLVELEGMLGVTDLQVSRGRLGLIVEHPKFVTHVNFLPPPDVSGEPIRAFVEIRSVLPSALQPVMEKSGEGAMFNRFATLGSITHYRGQFVVASRLTIFEQEDAWNIQLPLLMFATIAATESLLGAMHRTFGGVGAEREKRSKWTASDLKQVERMLSNFSMCNADGLGLTAEFGLGNGQISAIAGHKTALWQLHADVPHTEMGGGLFCLLQMPNRYKDDDRVNQVCAELNRMELIAVDQPPHFGAWCPGDSGHSLAYVSFLPNALHEVPGIATNFSIWAMHRADWAHKELMKLDAPAAKPVMPWATAERPPAPPKPAPPPAPVPVVRRSSAGWTDYEMVNIVRGIAGPVFKDDKLFELAQLIDVKLVGKPRPLSHQDIDAIVQPLYAAHRPVLYSELQKVVEALHRPPFRL